MNDEQLEFDLGADEKATNVTFGADGEAENKSKQDPAPAPQVQEESAQESHRNELDAVMTTSKTHRQADRSHARGRAT